MNHPQADPNRLPEPVLGTLDRALALVEFLRANCPWDARQTHASLRRYLLEESHEVVDAIDGGDDEGLRDELGDLLLNLAFQVVLAEERHVFDRRQVVEALEEKMRRRHPGLYGGEPAGWDRLKAMERAAQEESPPRAGLLGDLLAGSDPLAHAHRMQARVAQVGFDWPDATGAWAKVQEEMEEVSAELPVMDASRLEAEVGDLLFAVVNFARLAGVHPSLALQRASRKFARRFGRLEELAVDGGVKLEEAGIEALDRLWQEVKREEG